MQAFLQKLLGWLVPLFVGPLLERLTSAVKSYFARKREEKAIQDGNAAAREKLENATTPEERKDATSDIARRF